MLAVVGLVCSAAAGVPSVGSTTAASEARIVVVAFSSRVLGREKRFIVVRPANETASGGAVLFLLHGRGRNYRSLIDLEKTKTALLAAPFYVVLPDGEDGWYINSPVIAADRYNDYIEEVVRQAESRYPLSREKRRRAIAGWSMGGYGAVRFAETHRGEFGVVASIIGLLDFPQPEDLPEGQNYRVPADRFGSDPTMWRELNPSTFAEVLKGAQVLVVTATKAFDRTMNERFYGRVLAAGVACQFELLEGTHTIDVVQEALPVVLRFAAQHIVPTDTTVLPMPAPEYRDLGDRLD
jgi:S-formylglutathione hydrolase FrmB